MRIEGRMPGIAQHDGKPPIIDGNGIAGNQPSSHDDDMSLQRALEVEVADLLRRQNSKLLDEVAFSRGQLEKGSGTVSSPWSAVTAVNGLEPPAQPPKVVSTGMDGFAGQHRIGRDGSRTPRP